jgi:hypothetical protein
VPAAVQESLAQQEAMLTQGFERVAAELRRHAASVMPHPAADAGASIWTSPEVLGRLDALRTLLLQADGCVTLVCTNWPLLHVLQRLVSSERCP